MKKNLLMLLCAVSLANVSVNAADTADSAPAPDPAPAPAAPASPWFGQRLWSQAKQDARNEMNHHSFAHNVDHYGDHYGDIPTKHPASRPFRVWGQDAADYGRSVRDDWTSRWNNGWFKTGDEGNREFSRNAFAPGLAATAGRFGLAGGFGYGLHKNAYQNALLNLLRLAKAKEEGRMMNFARGRGGKYLSNLAALAAWLGLDAAAAYGGNQRSLAGTVRNGFRSLDRGLSSAWYDVPTPTPTPAPGAGDGAGDGEL